MKKHAVFVVALVAFEFANAGVNFYNCQAEGEAQILKNGNSQSLVFIVEENKVWINDSSRIWNQLSVDYHTDSKFIYKSLPPENFLQTGSLAATIPSEALTGVPQARMYLTNSEMNTAQSYNCRHQ